MPLQSPEERFHDNIVDLTTFLKEIIERCHNLGYTNIDPKVVEMVRGFLRGYHAEEIIKTFSIKSYEHWPSIKKHDEIFFKNHCNDVFSDLPKEYVDSFRKLFETYKDTGDPVITEEEKNIIWLYFESFVKISIHYIHENRRPDWDLSNNTMRKVYRIGFLPELKGLQKQVKIWNVKLKWPERTI